MLKIWLLNDECMISFGCIQRRHWKNKHSAKCRGPLHKFVWRMLWPNVFETNLELQLCLHESSLSQDIFLGGMTHLMYCACIKWLYRCLHVTKSEASHLSASIPRPCGRWGRWQKGLFQYRSQTVAFSHVRQSDSCIFTCQLFLCFCASAVPRTRHDATLYWYPASGTVQQSWLST